VRSVRGSYHGEVAPVECGDARDGQTFGDRDEAGVGAAKGEVGVALDKLADPGPVGDGEDFDCQLLGGERTVERRLGWRAELPIDQPAGLSDDQRRRDKGTGMAFKQLLATLVIRVGGISDGDDDIRIDEKAQRPNPSASRSSSSAARRPLVERPRPAKLSLRRTGNRSASTSPARSSVDVPRSAASAASRAATSSGRCTRSSVTGSG
jgi:hypothetical protein